MPDELYIYFAGLTDAALEILQLRSKLNSILMKYQAVCQYMSPLVCCDEAVGRALEQVGKELKGHERALEKHRVFLLRARDAYEEAQGNGQDSLLAPDYLFTLEAGAAAYTWVKRLLPQMRVSEISPAMRELAAGRLENGGDDFGVDRL